VSEKRQVWEERWGQRQGEDFHWYLREAPKELVALLEGANRPRGAALDLGCGNGVASAYLAQHFDLAVGLDIASAALRQARDLARGQGVGVELVVAEAPVLPFRDQAFGLVFDRGCLQGIPGPAWPVYFREVERVLAPGGMLQLFVSKPGKRSTGPLSSQRAKSALRRLLGTKKGMGKRKREPATFLSPPLIRRMMSPSMQELAMERFNFRTTSGVNRHFVYALFRKGA
jgi:ubiquinone/menaquinone biosynthesis C-methylase UbiE